MPLGALFVLVIIREQANAKALFLKDPADLLIGALGGEGNGKMQSRVRARQAELIGKGGVRQKRKEAASFRFVMLFHARQVLFKIPLVQKPRQSVLLEGGDGGGVKAEAALVCLQKRGGKHHVSDAEGGRHGFG